MILRNLYIASVVFAVGLGALFQNGSQPVNITRVGGNLITTTVPVSGSVTVTGGATAANQTNGTQKTQLVDGSGNVEGMTANAADINIKSGSIANTGFNVTGTLPAFAATPTVNSAESGTWTVQPGNTPNTTPWLTTDSATSATGAVVPSKAAYIGAIATTAIPTSATAGNTVGAMADKAGRLSVIPQAPRELTGMQSTTITSSTGATNMLTAGAAGVFNDITDIVFVNSSATGTVLTLSDGTKSYTYYCPATDMRGAVYQVPLAETTAATNWTVACTTSVASIIITVHYVTNK